MPQCVAFGCQNATSGQKRKDGLSFHKFPLMRPHVLEQWLTNIKPEKFTPSKHSRLCSEHFTKDCFEGAVYKMVMGEEKYTKIRLKDDAVPTIFSHKPPAMHSRPHTERRLQQKERQEVSLCPTYDYGEEKWEGN